MYNTFKMNLELVEKDFFLTARNTLSGLMKMGSRFQREKQHKIILWILY